MSVREWLIKTLSQRDFVPETTINAIVTHQYEGAAGAMKKHNSIEISGFGKFYFNEKKADSQMAKCLAQKKAYQNIVDDESTTAKKRHSYQERLKTVEKNMENLKEKNNEQNTGDL